MPPGPIANPGLGALRAVLAPATTDYLFFVAKNDGSHAFSETLTRCSSVSRSEVTRSIADGTKAEADLVIGADGEAIYTREPHRLTVRPAR